MSQIEKQIANSLFDSNGTSSGASDCYKIALEHMGKFAEWLLVNTVIAEDEYYFLHLKDLQPITTDQLINLYIESINQ